MARRGKKRRDVNGILVLDKALGLSSNGALQEVKRLFDAQKAGHTGSLDPLASGVLPLCFGEATKFSQFLLDADKKYTTTIRLGVITTTGDTEGDIVETSPVPELTDAELETALDKFRGEIEQIPSMFSAIKVNGQPLYKLARQGIEIERKSRTVMIHELKLLSRGADTVELDVHCSKGTYIRTIAEDLGKLLGCGAHVTKLRRTASGPFTLDDAASYETLSELRGEMDFAAIENKLLSPSTAVDTWPKVILSDLAVSYIKQGQPVQVSKAPVSGQVSIFSEATESDDAIFIGVGEIDEDGKVAPKRLIAT